MWSEFPFNGHALLLMLRSPYTVPKQPIKLMPNVFCIKRLRPVDVAGALNNGPSVGKDGEIVAISGEAEHEFVVRNLSL